MFDELVNCVDDPSQSMINDATVAGFYSTLAGVLAGFAFAALMLIVTFSLEKRRAQPGQTTMAVAPHTIAMLFAAFMSLAISSLTYAVVAGTDNRDAAPLGNASAAPTLSVSAFLLIMAIHLLIADADMGRPAYFASMRAVGLTLFIGAAYLLLGAWESSDQLGSDSLKPWASGWLMPASVVTLLGAIVPERLLDLIRSWGWVRNTRTAVIQWVENLSSHIDGWRFRQWHLGRSLIEMLRRHSLLTWFAELSVGLVVACSILVSYTVGGLNEGPTKVSTVALAIYVVVAIVIVRLSRRPPSA
ncbi:hypothetical protein ACIRON_30465 [Nocardioides sp. NPDC101246]|uniref:hypothetical protein n=1 Tax=Nocardioides sp. NPDC101246 TaxID=3364336 RepID=UPI0037F79E4D